MGNATQTAEKMKKAIFMAVFSTAFKQTHRSMKTITTEDTLRYNTIWHFQLLWASLIVIYKKIQSLQA